MAQIGSKDKVLEIVKKNGENIKKISDEIWNHPEMSWAETHAHSVLTTYLASEGFTVEKNFVRATGFRAIFRSRPQGKEGDDELTNVCFLCQYDALPEIGHGAGHNLLTAASVAAALAVKGVLQEKKISGMVTVLGTPGEDCGGGGKIEMIANQVFNNIDLCMMALPMSFNYLYPTHFRLLIVTVQYEGKAAHASAYPWEGRNALDAAVACYNNIALMRQQLKPTWMINGIITKGGTQANLIPANSELKFWIRAPTAMDMFLIQQRCTACFVAAAKATNTTAHFEFSESPYEVMTHSETMGGMFRKKARLLDIDYDKPASCFETHIGSTDMGNVSQEVPSICPTFNIGTGTILHSPSFHDAAGTAEAFEHTLKIGSAMALTALEFINDPTKLTEVRATHERMRKSSSTSLDTRMRGLARGSSEDQAHAH